MRIREKIQERLFLFSELVKRDFKHRYKGTVLGMGWSVISPILQLLVMRLVFTEFFGRNKPYYTTYVFAGIIIFSFFKESTTSGMGTLLANRQILTKVKLPMFLFLLSRNVSALINFLLTVCVYFIFAALDGLSFSWKYLVLIYPIICLTAMNVGIGAILSVLYVKFRDLKYLYDIFTLLLRYLSAIFYYIDTYAPNYQRLFLINPVYCFINYFRLVVINKCIPSVNYQLLCLFYGMFFLVLGTLIFKKESKTIAYYI